MVSSCVAALVVLGFAATQLRAKIPNSEKNQLAREGSEFLSRAAIQKIDWQKPTEETFARARRRDLPILLFIGSGYNPLARALDNGVFTSPRVQAFLARNFECIRVDTLHFPEYRNAFLPIRRGAIGFPTGCQLWVLDPSGQIVDMLPNLVSLFPTDEALFTKAMVEAKQKFEKKGDFAGSIQWAAAQEEDAQALIAPPAPVSPPISEYSTQLITSIYPLGGFGNDGPRILSPAAWRLLLVSGRVPEFRRSVDPVIRSPIVDLLDGGFFSGSRDSNWIDVDFDKPATANADMLSILSAASSILDDSLYRYLAERTFDSLMLENTLTNGFAAGRASDQIEVKRSPRSSFGVRKLKAALTDREDFEFAQKFLGMRVETNPRMSPFPADFTVIEHRERLDHVLQKLSENTGPRPDRTSPGFSDVTGFCVARLLESARILGDQARLAKAESLFPWVENSRLGDTVVHSPDPDLSQGYLGDYLAYSDAALQYYLVTGRQETILAGRATLLKALDLFKGQRLGVLRLGVDPVAPFPSALSLPEIADPGLESSLAYAIRLCMDYGRIFRENSLLRQFANAATGFYGDVALKLGVKGAGFFIAARRVFDDAFFVSVGPRAQEWSDLIARKSPWRLSVASFGEVRPDIRQRGPGVYVVRGESVRGPFEPEEALEQVSPFLGLGF